MSVTNLGEWRLRKDLCREREQDQARRDQYARERSEQLHRLLGRDPEPPSAA